MIDRRDFDLVEKVATALGFRSWAKVRWTARQPVQSLGAYLAIQVSGQLTARPKVHVSCGSRVGMHSLFTWDHTDVGDAHATMTGKSLAHILGLPLHDRRTPDEVDKARRYKMSVWPSDRSFHA